MMKYIQNISIDSHGILWVGEEIRVLHWKLILLDIIAYWKKASTYTP
jgi:hypothetical protein